ncbi:multiple myeloma tumor-associated protein 2 homolog [Uloborus diversus]|uniref:multiple myeloma tumor-associated protein 2 homolog n=1 Tax=Uloborus diversus TaxID=327109 RepID=UPI00240A5347|nr:multiple myeloma tumor-associated protein 2 homolog [Uloborus diversus]
MYNPSRGGVRGGADQFTWESVKTDKHRENYLGHSLKAPVGRWQKGKDLSWYAKERKEGDASVKNEKSELAAIKRAEEEAMLIALGHNIVRKESQALTKEEMKEALRRNVGERDEYNIERVDGVGATSRRAAMMSGISKTTKGEGVTFESYAGKEAAARERKDASDMPSNFKKKKSKKSSKKHKKEKKKHRKRSSDSENEVEHHSRHVRSSKYDSIANSEKEKKGKRRRHDSRSSHSDSDRGSRIHSHSRHKSGSAGYFPHKRRHDSSDSG